MIRLLAAFLVLGSAALAQTGEKVPLVLTLPKPLFEGTPRPIQVSNLEPPVIGKRPPLLVPAGTVLLSLNKPVTASDPLPVIGDLTCVTDGDKSGVEGSYVELGPGVQWVQIDLGAPAKLAAIAVWHFHSQARVYRDVVAQVSDDPTFKSGVTTIFNNDFKNEIGAGAGKDQNYVETYQGKLIDAKGAKGRYIRFYSNGNTTNKLNDYIEVEVWGKPA